LKLALRLPLPQNAAAFKPEPSRDDAIKHEVTQMTNNVPDRREIGYPNGRDASNVRVVEILTR
jgi:hypothetical protein